MFENFKIYGVVDYPDYAEYYDQDDEGIFVSVQDDNVPCFKDWAEVENVKIEKV